MSSFDRILIWLDSAVCSQNPAHSLWIDGKPLPLCARDLGLFTGVLLGLLVLGLWRPSWTWLYLAGLLPMVIDGSNSFAADAFGFSLYPPDNVLRLTTGLLAGISLAVLVQRRARPLCVPIGLRPSGAESKRVVSTIPPAPCLQRQGEKVRLLSRLLRCGGAGALMCVSAFSAVTLSWTNPYLAVALLGTAGVFALAAVNNQLIRPMPRLWAMAIALPELAFVAAAKQGLLLLLR